MTETHSPKASPPKPSSRLGSPSQQHYGPYDVLLDAIPDIESGERVWILLDPAGKPISVQREVPDYGVSACAGAVGNLYDNSKPHLTTLAGADLSDTMNNSPEKRLPESAPPPPATLGAQGTSSVKANEKRT
jgi:hypothetical protein